MSHGGCGGNIAFNLAPFAHQTSLFSISGGLDDAPLVTKLQGLGIDVGAILRFEDAQTAQATIVTDPAGTQLTAWYPGPEPTAVEWAQHLRTGFKKPLDLFIQAPLRGDLMLAGISQARKNGLPTIWCPGQFTDQLKPEVATEIVEQVTFIIANGYELQILEQLADLNHCTTIRTHGPDPIRIQTPSWKTEVTVPGVEVIDPTGCGDAFLAGVVHILAGAKNYDWSSLPEPTLCRAVEFGISMAHQCIGHQGCQAHEPRLLRQEST